jgi:hypothetical protein
MVFSHWTSVRSWQSVWHVVLALAVHDALQAFVQVGMHSVTLVTFFSASASPHIRSHFLLQLCSAQRPHAFWWSPYFVHGPELSPSLQSATHSSMQLGASDVVTVVVQSFTHVWLHELSHSTDAVAVQLLSH